MYDQVPFIGFSGTRAFQFSFCAVGSIRMFIYHDSVRLTACFRDLARHFKTDPTEIIYNIMVRALLMWRRGVVVKTVASCSKSSGLRLSPVCELFECRLLLFSAMSSVSSGELRSLFL
jgi:hypothetical protein